MPSALVKVPPLFRQNLTDTKIVEAIQKYRYWLDKFDTIVANYQMGEEPPKKVKKRIEVLELQTFAVPGGRAFRYPTSPWQNRSLNALIRDIYDCWR